MNPYLLILPTNQEIEKIKREHLVSPCTTSVEDNNGLAFIENGYGELG